MAEATPSRSRSKLRKSLRALAAQMPLSNERIDHIISLASQPDRATAIAATAYLEDGLKIAILRYMKETLSALETDRLFDQYQGGVLSTFDDRIQVAYALGILENESKSDFDIIRRVRNVFAHSILDVSFENKEIADAISELSMASRIDANTKLVFIYIAVWYYTRLLMIPWGWSVEADLHEIARELMKPSP